MGEANAGRVPRAGMRRAREAQPRGWKRPDLVAELERQEIVLGTGERLGVDAKLVEKWERGTVCPRIFYQARLCLLFGSRPEWLDLPPTARLYREIERLRRLRDENGCRDSNHREVEQPPGDSPGPATSQLVVHAGKGDGRVLDGLHAATLSYGRVRDVMRPADLYAPVQQHLERLLGLLRWQSGGRSARVAAMASQAAIIAGWLAFNLGQPGRSLACWMLGHQLAVEAGSADLQAYALGCRSRLYSVVHCGEQAGAPGTALHLLDRAVELSGRSFDPALRSWLLVNRAEQLATSGRLVAAYRDLERADRAIVTPGTRDEVFWANWSETRVHGYRGNCARLLKQNREATEVLEGCLAEADPAIIPAATFMRSDLAAAYAQERHVDQACALLSDSLSSAHHLGFAEGIDRIARVRETNLVEFQDSSDVKSFDELRMSLAGH